MDKQQSATFQSILKSAGYSLTKPRTIIFRLLLHDEPQTMAQIIARADGLLDRVTVYRTIELFEKLGIVHRLYIGWKYKLELSDQFIDHHHHLTCLRCGSVVDIEDEQHIDGFIQQIAQQYNFELRRHQFEIEGLCADCRSLHGTGGAERD